MSHQRNSVVYGITVGISALTLLRGQLAWLREHGWDVHLAVTPDSQAHKAADRERVTLEPLPMTRNISPKADLVALTAWVRLLVRVKPAAVNVSTPKAGLLGGLAAFATRVPRRVYVLRGLRLEGASGVLAKVLWAIERLTVATATDVVVVSPSLAADAHARRLLPVRKRVWLIGEGSSNGVPAAAVQAAATPQARRQLRDELSLADDDMVVGYVGRITVDKGVATLLDAMAALPGDARVKLLAIGSIDDAPLAGRLDALGDRIVHVDWVDDPWRYYAAMDVLCLPTRREGFPNVVLEAAAAGLPTVTTRATGAVDSVVDQVTGYLVDVEDSPALQQALAALATTPSLRTKMGEAARDRVERQFQPELIWAGVASLLAGQPGPDVHRL